MREQFPFGEPKHRSTVRPKVNGLVGSPTRRMYNAHDKVPAEVRFGMSEEDKTYDGSPFAKTIILGSIEEISDGTGDKFVQQECFNTIGDAK